MKVKNSKRLGAIAVDEGVLTPAQLQECLAAQRKIAEVGCRKQIGEVMVDKRFVDAAGRDRLLDIQRQQHQLRYMGDYELGAKLGQGGMGAVYKATHVRDRTKVALKVLSKDIGNEPGGSERFEREATLAQTLIHPHLVRTFGLEEIDGRRVLVMECIEGTPLDQRIATLGRLDEHEALRITQQLALALAYVGSKGIIHRDIKPGNVMIDRAGDAKLLDLGLARFAQTATRTQITMTGQIIGTPDFMAPEQISGQELDVRTDVYALGATLYSMVTGQAPYAGRGSHQAVLLAHLVGSLRDPLELAPDLSEGAVHIIEKAMATDPDDRYQNMEAFAAEVETVMRGQPPTTQRPSVQQTTVARTVPTARRNAKARRRRPSGRHAGPPSAARANAWIGPVIAGAALLAAIAALVGGSGRRGEEGSGAGSGPLARIVPASGSGSGSIVRAASASYVDPNWGYVVELAQGWSAERGPDGASSTFGGPNGAVVEIETRALEPRCPDVPIDALADVERQVLARRQGVAVETVVRQSFRMGDGALQAVSALGPGGKVEVVGYLQTAACVHRVAESRLTEEELRAFLGRVRFDPRAEELAAERVEQSISFEHPSFSVWHSKAWTPTREGPAVVLTNGAHRLTVRGGAYEAVHRACDADPRLRDYTQSDMRKVCGVPSAFAVGITAGGLIVVRLVAELPDRLGLGVFAELDTTRMSFDAMLAPWRVAAMARVGPVVQPVVEAPVGGGAQIVDDPASRTRLFERWGWQPSASYTYSHNDSNQQVIGHGVTSINVSAETKGDLPAGVMFVASKYSPQPFEMKGVKRTAGWSMAVEAAGVRLLFASSIDDATRVTRSFMYHHAVDAWHQHGQGGERGEKLADGRLDGIYDPCTPVAHQLWLHGWEIVPDATRRLRLLDVWGARVVELTMKVRNDPGPNRHIECAIDGRRVCYIVLADTLSQGIMVRHEGGSNIAYGRN